MTCYEVRELVPLMPSGDLSESETQSLLAHVAECATCRQLLSEYEKTHSIICVGSQCYGVPSHPGKAPAEFVHSVTRAIRLDQEGRRSNRWSVWLPGLGRVAALLALAMGTGMFIRGLNGHRHERHPSAQGNIIVVTFDPLTGQVTPLKNWTVEQNESGVTQVVLHSPGTIRPERQPAPSPGSRITDDDIDRGIDHLNKLELYRNDLSEPRYETVTNPGHF